jgi:squalene-hopene/tetraprenyl-beta-curcumene cyclase
MAAVVVAAAAVAASRERSARGTEPAPGPRKELAPNAPDEPLAPAYSSAKAAQFLDAVALDWTRKRQCGTCHTNYAYLITRPALKGEPSSEMLEIRTFFEGRVAHWDDAEKSAKPRWDAEVVATGASLALSDALTTGKLHPRTRQALDRMWSLQKPDGSWNWIKCGWPPLEHDDYYGAVFAALGVGSAPEGYAKSEPAQAGLVRLRAYLRSTPAPDLHHKTFLLWASTRLDGLVTPEARDETLQQLRRLQRSDGGWSLPSLGHWMRRDGTPNPEDPPSDGYATGLVVYVLRQAGVPASDPGVRKGADWLRSHQRASGRWFTRSLNNDKAHYIANAGSGFAVLALSVCDAD